MSVRLRRIARCKRCRQSGSLDAIVVTAAVSNPLILTTDLRRQAGGQEPVVTRTSFPEEYCR